MAFSKSKQAAQYFEKRVDGLYSKEFSYKGKEYTFLLKDPGLLEELKCPICLELVNDAKQTSCGHVFCARCIKVLNQCPVCRVKCQIFPDNRTMRQVRNLQVKCLNSKQGCKWQGDLGDCDDHMTNKCLAEATPCPMKCGLRGQRHKMRDHTNKECKLRPFPCRHCGREGVFDLITTSHYTICSSYPLPCPAGCRKTVKRGDMKHHLATCEEELVACKYSQIGCDSVIKRKDLNKHLQDEKEGHLEKALVTVSGISMALSRSCSREPFEPPFRHWLCSKSSCYPLPPLIIKMDNFDIMKKQNKIWFSAPFYSHFGGYKMCLRVDANGFGDGKGTNVSVCICLMKGENDDNIKWPFRGTITVTLLNQLQPDNHHSNTIRYANEISANSTIRVMEERGAGFGRYKLISHNDLKYNEEKNSCYLKGDALYFRIDSVEVEPGDFHTREEATPSAPPGPWLSALLSYQPPHIIRLSGFKSKTRMNTIWFSAPFYTHFGGYKMCLRVYTNGNGDGKGTHLSVYIHLMKGEYDGNLKWPFRGTITVTLLNQLQPNNHHLCAITYDKNTSEVYNARVKEGTSGGWGSHKFIPHTVLYHITQQNIIYLKYDCLYFSVDLKTD